MNAIAQVAGRLGNTPTVCRKSYIHPTVIDAYLEGTMLASLKSRTEAELGDLAHLSPEEAAVLAFLRDRLAQEEIHDREK